MIRLAFGLALFLASCTSSQNVADKPWPEKLQNIETGLKVEHSTDTVFATINTKDPEKRGKYQMKFTTSVESINEDLEVVEFGAYFWENEEWVLTSIYDRPFNQEEFKKWYGSEDGMIQLGKKYADMDNWLAKSDYLSGRQCEALLYFIAKNSKGQKFMGAKEVVGVMKMKK
ncbi:MAG: hypothetical protein AB8B56_16825 [Crocinitomicaceae bacterium]